MSWRVGHHQSHTVRSWGRKRETLPILGFAFVGVKGGGLGLCGCTLNGKILNLRAGMRAWERKVTQVVGYHVIPGFMEELHGCVCVCVHVCAYSVMSDSVIPQTALPMEFSRARILQWVAVPTQGIF